jgi:hypothetical protein
MEELETEIEGILINGVDIIKFSDDGRARRRSRLSGNTPDAARAIGAVTPWRGALCLT